VVGIDEPCVPPVVFPAAPVMFDPVVIFVPAVVTIVAPFDPAGDPEHLPRQKGVLRWWFPSLCLEYGRKCYRNRNHYCSNCYDYCYFAIYHIPR
jgi:hypothetical protein